MGHHESNLIRPMLGQDYEALPTGVIRVARCNVAPSIRIGEEKPAPAYIGMVDHALALKHHEYEKRLAAEEERFQLLARQLKARGRSLLIVLQGKDLAGKSGASKRFLEAVESDPKLIAWIGIDKPYEDDLNHPFFWRFFQEGRFPRTGEIRILDRSYHERVLAERVKELIDHDTLLRSYGHLRALEWLFAEQGVIIVKFFLDITFEEQGKRLEERLKEKAWKFSPEDEKARKKWDIYCRAENDMIHYTGTPNAPWNIIAATDKHYARVVMLSTTSDTIEAAFR